MQRGRLLTNSAAASDAVLLAGIAARNQQSLVDLYDLHGGLVFALCLRIVHDRMIAEEVLEDVFWEVWKRAERYDPERGSARTYLLQLARSRAIDRLRVMRNHPEPPQGPEGQAMWAADAQASTEAEPLAGAMRSEQRDIVRRALDRLAPEQRAALELAFFDGLTHHEIAQRLAQPLGTVKTRIRQALVHLRDALSRSDGRAAID